MTKDVQMTMLRAQIANLETIKAENEVVLKKMQEEIRRARDAHDALERVVKETREKFADLKERLYNAEMENQRLRGYVARVQEDDVVREELVTTGDPDGEQMMVPKRRSTLFGRPSDMTTFGNESSIMGYTDYGERAERKKPKHWLSY